MTSRVIKVPAIIGIRGGITGPDRASDLQPGKAIDVILKKYP